MVSFVESGDHVQLLHLKHNSMVTFFFLTLKRIPWGWIRTQRPASLTLKLFRPFISAKDDQHERSFPPCPNFSFILSFHFACPRLSSRSTRLPLDSSGSKNCPSCKDEQTDCIPVAVFPSDLNSNHNPYFIVTPSQSLDHSQDRNPLFFPLCRTHRDC